MVMLVMVLLVMVVVVVVEVIVMVMMVVVRLGYLIESYRNHCGRECHLQILIFKFIHILLIFIKYQIDHGGVEEVERFGVALVVMWRRGGMYRTEQHSIITQDVPHFVPQQLNLIKHLRLGVFGAPEDGGHLRDPLHQCL